MRLPSSPTPPFFGPIEAEGEVNEHGENEQENERHLSHLGDVFLLEVLEVLVEVEGGKDLGEDEDDADGGHDVLAVHGDGGSAR